MLLTVGCSNSYAVGVSNNERYSSIVATRLNTDDWNMSLSGCSNDYISNIIHDYRKYLNSKTDIVLVQFTYIHRREWFDPRGNYHTFIINYSRRNKYRPFYDLVSEVEDINNFNKNFQYVKNLLKGYKWLYCTIHDSNIREDNYVGQFEKVDVGMDGGHPGIMSHQKMAQQYLEKIL